MQRRLIASTVIVLTLAAALPAHAAPQRSAASVTTQLPRTAVPRHYDVALVPNAAASTFTGKVTITLDVVKATSTITLNAADLAFTRAVIKPATGSKATPARTSIDKDNQTA